MMVKVLIYGYATGVFSSRKMAAKMSEDVAFRMLGSANFRRTGRFQILENCIWRSSGTCLCKW